MQPHPDVISGTISSNNALNPNSMPGEDEGDVVASMERLENEAKEVSHQTHAAQLLHSFQPDPMINQ